MPTNREPPPGAVFELAEQAVDFVKRALGLPLDYTAETLPLLDHYLRAVPRDRGEIVALTATVGGAYFGEVVRKTMDGVWELRGDDPEGWHLVLPTGVRFSPVSFVTEVIAHGPVEDIDGGIDVLPEDREYLDQVLTARPEIPEDEFYSVSGRLETLLEVVDIIGSRPREPETETETETELPTS